MPGVYEYIISMQDRASGTLQKLTGTSYETVQKFAALQEKTDALKRNTADFGNSIGNLKQKIDLLQQERDLINPENITKIRQYNREISSLANQVQRLENTTGGKFKTYAKDAFSQIPGAGLLTNPLVLAGAGIAAVSKLGMNWDTGMAKINTTAQLSGNQLDALGSTIKKLGVDAGADLAKVPIAYEKIISQVNDVALSTDILAISLKGAKAGFTDIDIVAGAAAQSISAIGQGKATAAEVMDTLFAAKRVGAGEFVDFANNIPGLIAAGKNVGVTWKEVSGAFAYMTGQGNNAADSTMLLQNAFTALGKSEITGGLEAAGVAVFDKTTGQMRGLLPLMTDLGKLMRRFGKDDKAKSNFLEAIGLKDQQAKQAFSVLTNEISKLQEAMSATGNAAGEMQSALDQTNTPANKLKQIWSNITGTGLGLGGVINAILNPLLDATILLFSGIYSVVNSVGAAWNWWVGLLQQGNPIIWGLTTLVGGLAASLALQGLWLGIVSAASGIMVVKTWLLTAAQWALNTALSANPIGLIVGLVIAIGVAVYAAWDKFEGFRMVVLGTWEAVKQLGNVLYELVIGRLADLLKGIGKIGEALYKLFTGKFADAWQTAKDGIMDFSGMNAAKRAYEEGTKVGEAYRKGTDKGSVSYSNSQYKKKDDGFRFNQPVIKDNKPGIPAFDVNTMIYGAQDKVPRINKGAKSAPAKPEKPAKTTEQIMTDIDAGKKLRGKKKGQKDKSVALGLPQNYNQTNAYSVITAKFGTQPDLAIKDQKKDGSSPTEKPVINMATRVEEIAGSLRKLAAATAIPVMMAVGAANANPAGLMPVKQNALIENVANSAANYDGSTTSLSTDNSKSYTTNNSKSDTINNQGKTAHFDRFTDKIEIHVTGADSPKLVADQVRYEVEKALAEILNV